MPAAIQAVTTLDKGLVRNVPRHLIPEGSFYVSENMTIFKGEVAIAPGYARFNNQLLSGAIMLIDEFPMESGITHLLVFTTQRAYRYDPNINLFIDITGNVFHGDLSNIWQSDVVANPDGDLMYVATNGRLDPVKKWTGAGTFVNLGGATADSGNHFSESVAGFENLLVHLNRFEGNQEFPRRVRWSDDGVPESYTGGLAGYLTLFQGADHGVTLAAIGNYLAAYRERSIHLLSFIGAPFVLAQRQVVVGIGLVAPRAILNLDVRHVFLGNDNVYIFNGVDIEPIGTVIRDELFQTIDPLYIHRSLILLDEPRNEMMLIVPEPGSNGVPNVWWYWNLTSGAWSGPVRPRPCTGGGSYERRTTETWDNSIGSWDSDPLVWDSAAALEAFPVLLFGNEAQLVYEIDSGLTTQDGVPIEGDLESGSFMPGAKMQPPTDEALITQLMPLTSDQNVTQVGWWFGRSDLPVGPWEWFGPYFMGVRGIVKMRPTRGRWFVIAADASIAFRVSGFIVEFERGATS